MDVQLYPIGSRRTQRDLDGLTVLRVLFVALMQAALAGGLILVIITRNLGTIETPLLLLILGLGLAGFAVALWLRNRPPSTDSAEALIKSYRSTFFAGFAACEVGLLAGLALGITRQELWPYLLSLPLFLLGMAAVAPSQINIERVQSKLGAAGSTLSLRDALMGPAPKKGR